MGRDVIFHSLSISGSINVVLELISTAGRLDVFLELITTSAAIRVVLKLISTSSPVTVILELISARGPINVFLELFGSARGHINVVLELIISTRNTINLVNVLLELLVMFNLLLGILPTLADVRNFGSCVDWPVWIDNIFITYLVCFTQWLRNNCITIVGTADLAIFQSTNPTFHFLAGGDSASVINIDFAVIYAWTSFQFVTGGDPGILVLISLQIIYTNKSFNFHAGLISLVFDAGNAYD